MTRISSLIVATSLAILPLSAFAQQTGATDKTTAPAGVVTTAPTGTATAAPMAAGKTSTGMATGVAQPTKPDAKAPAVAEKPAMNEKPTVGAKKDLHGANSGKTLKQKTVAEPAKS